MVRFHRRKEVVPSLNNQLVKSEGLKLAVIALNPEVEIAPKRRGRPPGSRNRPKSLAAAGRGTTRGSIKGSSLAVKVKSLVDENKSLKTTVQNLETALKQIQQALPS